MHWAHDSVKQFIDQSFYFDFLIGVTGVELGREDKNRDVCKGDFSFELGVLFPGQLFRELVDFDMESGEEIEIPWSCNKSGEGGVKAAEGTPKAEASNKTNEGNAEVLRDNLDIFDLPVPLHH